MNDELEPLIAAIRDAWEGSQTPPDLRAACTAFVSEHPDLVDKFRAITLVTFGVWISTTSDETGTPRNVLEQIVAVETYKCVAMMMREAREREGGKLIPARAAIVAYMLNEIVAKAEPFRCDLQAATDVWLSGEVTDPVEAVS